MAGVDETEDVFFDTADHLLVVEEDKIFSNSDFNIWLKEPQSVKDRRDNFLSQMGFTECSTSSETEMVSLQTTIESCGDVSICHSSIAGIGDNLLAERQRSNSEANSSVDYSDGQWLDYISLDGEGGESQDLMSPTLCQQKQAQTQTCVEENAVNDKKQHKSRSWWRHFVQMMKKNRGVHVSKRSIMSEEAGKMRLMWTEMNRNTEWSAVYVAQELKAHKGRIGTMKFSPDGKYLATGGEDGLVCIWLIDIVNHSFNGDKCSFRSLDMDCKLSTHRKKLNQASVVIAEKIFHMEEEPLQKFQAHCGDVLDLAWSKSNKLLSSSTDKTVCLWQPGSDECLGVFHHKDYVTCIQFNPVDENYFISGSIDGKVRIWDISKRRVEDWADVRDLVTALCYQPNGKGFVVGLVSGRCRFYELVGEDFPYPCPENMLLLNAEMNMQSRKKSSRGRVTGIQFLKNDSQRVMITTADAKVRIFDGLEVVSKYRGLHKSSSQSASFTSSGQHIVSLGDDSRIYLWNYKDSCIKTSSKTAKSTRSCEHFFCDGATVALPWLVLNKGHDACPSSGDHYETSSAEYTSERFSLSNWFSADASSRSSTTWPEEKLPLCDLLSREKKSHRSPDGVYCFHQQQKLKQKLKHVNRARNVHATRGLVFVVGTRDGRIRTLVNYGFPVQV